MTGPEEKEKNSINRKPILKGRSEISCSPAVFIAEAAQKGVYPDPKSRLKTSNASRHAPRLSHAFSKQETSSEMEVSFGILLAY